MPNMSKFRQRIEHQRATPRAGIRVQRGGGSKVPTLRMKDIDDGTYRIRFWPAHPEKCCDGFIHSEYHSIEPTEDAPWKNHIQILSSSCYDDPATAPKYMDEILDLIESEISPVFNDLSPALQNAIDLLNIRERLCVPIAIWADKRTEANTVDGKTYQNLHLSPNDYSEPSGYVWEVRAQGLIDRIFEVYQTLPQVNDMWAGHCLRFTKANNSYSLMPEPIPSPFPPSVVALVKEHYPNLDSWTKKMRKSNTEMYRALSNAWYAPELVTYGIDITP